MKKSSVNKSFVQRFIFDQLPVRGVFVVLEDVWQTIAGQKEYPDGLMQILGELLSANILLTANLKLKGKVIAQIHNNPKVDLVVRECSHDFNLRATAKFSESVHKDNQISYADCLDVGRLVISIDANNDGKLYQSIVALSGMDLSDTLDEYMLQSEQLKTKFVLAYSKHKVVGFMLQQLPDIDQKYELDVERIFKLAETLTHTELLIDEIPELLHKLFNEDDVILFEPHSVHFLCRCGRESVANMLRSLGKDEVESIIAELGKIEVTCDFCNSVYTFNAFDAHNILSTLDMDMQSISSEVH